MRLVCIGDSLTFGYGLHKNEKWVTMLGEKLDWEVLNAGINGDTSGGALARVRTDVIAQKPDMVLVMTGGNDFIAGCEISAVKANITAITMQCAAAGIKVFVSSEIPTIPEAVVPQWRSVADFDAYNRKQKEMCEWFPKYCRSFEFTYIDLYSKYSEATSCSMEYYQDGIHPNKAGNEIFADIFYQVLSKFS